MPDIDQTVAFNQSVENEDKVSKAKTIYDAPPLEIFWRNFLAGASRALGGIFLYFIFLSVVSVIFIRYVAPLFAPLMEQLNSLTGTLDSLPRFPDASTILPR